MKNKKLAFIGGCVLTNISLIRIQLAFKLTQKEAELLKSLTFTDEGEVPLTAPVPAGVPKMKVRLGLIETGLFDYIIGCVINKEKFGKLNSYNEENLQHAHSMLKKFIGDDYSLISFEPNK